MLRISSVQIETRSQIIYVYYTKKHPVYESRLYAPKDGRFLKCVAKFLMMAYKLKLDVYFSEEDSWIIISTGKDSDS